MTRFNAAWKCGFRLFLTHFVMVWEVRIRIIFANRFCLCANFGRSLARCSLASVAVIMVVHLSDKVRLPCNAACRCELAFACFLDLVNNFEIMSVDLKLGSFCE